MFKLLEIPCECHPHAGYSYIHQIVPSPTPFFPPFFYCRPKLSPCIAILAPNDVAKPPLTDRLPKFVLKAFVYFFNFVIDN